MSLTTDKTAVKAIREMLVNFVVVLLVIVELSIAHTAIVMINFVR